MNLLGLRYFIAVNEYQSFTKAAEYLYVSQPTLSRQIADLEEELGVLLFERKYKSISLTKAGEECLRQAKEIIEKCDEMKEAVQQAYYGEKRALQIGYLGDVDYDLIEEPLHNLLNHFPDLNITLRRTSYVELNQFLLEGIYDAIYAVQASIDSVKELEFVKIAKNSLKLLVPNDHPLSGKKSVSVAELRDQKFVMFERNYSPLTVDSIVAMCVSNGFSPSVVYFARDVQSVIYAVSMGKGVAFLSERVRLEEHSQVSFLDLEDCPLDFDICIAYKKENHNPYLPLFIDEVKEWANG